MQRPNPFGAIGRGLQALQNLCHASATDSQKPRQRRPAFELAGVEQRLVIPGEPERIAGRLTGVSSLLLS